MDTVREQRQRGSAFEKLQPRQREEQPTHPTMVTPIGQGALPIERRRYASLARWY